MANIISLREFNPEFGKDCWLAESSTIVGDVIMGDNCSVWFNAVIRGDVNSIRMGDRVNVQDNAIIHCTYEQAATTIGDDVSIGHSAIVHGCTIHDKVLIGMGAIVMDHCVVESGSIIAAGAVVLENTHVQSGSVYAGVPAKKVKDISPELFKGQVERIARNYMKYSSWYED